jgi:transposase-like protein
MKKTNKFSPEVRERAVRMVQEQRGEYAPPSVMPRLRARWTG